MRHLTPSAHAAISSSSQKRMRIDTEHPRCPKCRAESLISTEPATGGRDHDGHLRWEPGL